jgi:hypothetical protein
MTNHNTEGTLLVILILRTKLEQDMKIRYWLGGWTLDSGAILLMQREDVYTVRFETTLIAHKSLSFLFEHQS